MSCGVCFGTGTVLALQKDSDIHTPFAFVCHCSRARRRNFPQWHAGLNRDYEVLEQQSPDYSGPRKPTPTFKLREVPK